MKVLNVYGGTETDLVGEYVKWFWYQNAMVTMQEQLQGHKLKML
ncbi:hypothetical protein [Selenomonas ruminantium]|uniref:Uncharacterized protein n=1 Tax=Selenomonas ruminantium TaxID=971 RepID=A0A1K1M675_SELRU|nr:hypothetical protein [Selenomonas ruminantium]SFW18674.1 hypothetical protein SAMN02910323_0609 [Selenomonas ruminantium]